MYEREREEVELEFGLQVFGREVLLLDLAGGHHSCDILNIFRYILQGPNEEGLLQFAPDSLIVHFEYDIVREDETNYSTVEMVNYNFTIESDEGNWSDKTVDLVKRAIAEDIQSNEQIMNRFYNSEMKGIINDLAPIAKRSKELTNFIDTELPGIEKVLLHPAYLMNLTKNLKSIVDQPLGRAENEYKFVPAANIQQLIYNELEDLIVASLS